MTLMNEISGVFYPIDIFTTVVCTRQGLQLTQYKVGRFLAGGWGVGGCVELDLVAMKYRELFHGSWT